MVENKKITFHNFFRAAIFIKGIDGFFQLIFGAVLFFVTSEQVTAWVHYFVDSELLKDPHDFVSNYLIHFAQNFSFSVKTFVVFYLLSHGIIKLFLVFALWKEKKWAYPSVEFVLLILVAYQLVRFSFTHSILLLLLTLLDVAIIILTRIEYEGLRKNWKFQKFT